MAKGNLTTEQIKKNSIHSMLESLIAGKSDEAGEYLHDYLQIKTRELIMGESKDDYDDDYDDDDDDMKSKKDDYDDMKSKKSKKDDDDYDDDMKSKKCKKDDDYDDMKSKKCKKDDYDDDMKCKKDDDYDDKKSKKSKKDDYDDDMKYKKSKKEKVDEQSSSSAFSRSGSVMSDVISGKIKFENGGKKTLKKHGNACKELDDDKVDKTKFKSGGKQPMKTLEKTPKPEKFNDGRDKELGTTKA